MTLQYSFAQIKCIINGEEFQGWADDDPPYTFTFEESTERTMGRDGALYALGLPMYGGQFEFRMQANSPTTQWAIQQEQLRKNAHRDGTPFTGYEGTLSDPVTNISYRMDGGVIVLLPAVAVPGETYVGQLYFESIASNVDAAQTRGPLGPVTNPPIRPGVRFI